MKALVVIPTYNEAENVKLMIRAVLNSAPDIEVLIVDDNSPDKTWKIVEKLRKENRRIQLIKNRGKIGLGPAYIIGIKYALDSDYDYIIQMDCDFSHDPEMIPSLLKLAKRYDFVVGSRYTKGGRISGWGKKRLILSSMGNLYVRLFLGSRIRDWTAGFVCWKKEILRSIKIDADDCPNGYAFQVSLKFRALQAGFKPKETPIVFRDRTKGITKMHDGIINEAAITIIKLWFSKNKTKKISDER